MEYQNKEFGCIYKIDEILSNYDHSIEENFQKIVEIIPSGWRYSDACEAQLVLGTQEFKTKGFKDSILKMQSEIILEQQIEGVLTIVYTKNFREEKGVFLSGEHQLLKAINNKLTSYLMYHRLQETISKLQMQAEPEGEMDKTENQVTKWLKAMDLKDNEIAELMRVKIEFKKGETIFKQGAIASYVILLTNGLSKNYVEGNFDKGFNFKIIKPINFIGLSSVYGKNIYAFSGSALTKCSAFLIDVQVFKNIMSRNHNFTNRILNWYCDVAQSHMKRMSSIANKQALGRLSETLIYLSDEIFGGKIVTTNVSRKDIAELAAMSTESAVRFLSDLKRDQIIDITTNHIELLKRDVLNLLSNN